MLGTTYGATTSDWDSVGQATATAAGWAMTVYGLQGMYVGWQQSVINYWGNVPLATGEFAARQYVNAWARREVAEYAAKHGMSATEFNLVLLGFSAIGNDRFGSRFQAEGWDTTKYGFRGWGSRGPLALPFDVVDTVLAVQGLPTASTFDYFRNSAARGQPLSGHSLGSIDLANLSSWGFAAQPHYFGVPFGTVTVGGPVTLGSNDWVAGSYSNRIFNWNAEVLPNVGHDCGGISGCGVSPW